MGFIEEAAVYVLKYAPQFGIKVHSPLLAQFVLESASGTSELARNAWNIAGLKYREGRCPSACGAYYKDGAEQNPDGTYTNSAMKWFKFPSMEAGVKGYFEFINTPNYVKLKGVTDPRTYLELIKAAGYATSLNYVNNLMAVIEKYNLTKYDNVETGVTPTMPTVFLSAGHGGNDPGAIAFGLKEKDINLQTLLACRAELERHGVKVVASRMVDEDDPVAQEVKEANESGADIAVSFHANAGGGDGFEAFYYNGSAKGKRLAQLCEKYVKELGQNSRGVKTNNLKFTRETTMIAVLVESFFVDSEDRLIGDMVAEQKAFGVAYAKAILEYLGIAYKSATEAETASDVIYRVQLGAYRNKENAQNLVEELEKKGYKPFIAVGKL